MAVDRGPKNLHEHNKSLLYSNRPKFKEDIRDNIYVDRFREDGIMFSKVTEEDLQKVLAKIRMNARKEFFRQLKMLAVSILITILILIYLKDYLDQSFV